MRSLRQLLFLLGFVALLQNSSSATIDSTVAQTVASTTTTKPLPCPDAYYEVGGRCVLVNPFLEGTWDEAGYYCSTLGSYYVEIETVQFYLDLLDFLRDSGLDEHSYWLGARDVVEEGKWVWEVNGGVVPMGTPFWAIEFDYGDNYFMEPTGKNYSNCLRLDHHRFMYLDDHDCTSHNSFMCQLLL